MNFTAAPNQPGTLQTIIKKRRDHPDGALIWPLRIIAKIRNKMQIPPGYEDETGFHFGDKPDVMEILPQSLQGRAYSERTQMRFKL